VEYKIYGTFFFSFFTTLGPNPKGGTRVYRIDPRTGVAKLFAEGLRGASGNAFGPDGLFYQSNIGADTIARIRTNRYASICVDD